MGNVPYKAASLRESLFHFEPQLLWKGFRKGWEILCSLQIVGKVHNFILEHCFYSQRPIEGSLDCSGDKQT